MEILWRVLVVVVGSSALPVGVRKRDMPGFAFAPTVGVTGGYRGLFKPVVRERSKITFSRRCCWEKDVHVYVSCKMLSDPSTDISVAVFYSFNSPKEYDGNYNHPAATIEDLMQCNKSGKPPHELRLMKNCICTITRNLDVNAGLVTNRRVIVYDIHRNFVTIRLIGTNFAKNLSAFCIPRINFTSQPARCLWTVDRRQFPLRIAYATTFNSCQGLTLDTVVWGSRKELLIGA